MSDTAAHRPRPARAARNVRHTGKWAGLLEEGAANESSSDGNCRDNLLPRLRRTPPHGEIRICHSPGIITGDDNKTMLIPRGWVFLTFTNIGHEIVAVHTTAAVHIGPKPHCVTAPAVLDQNLTGHPIGLGFRLNGTREPLWWKPSRADRASIADEILDVQATVVSPFQT